MKYPLDSSWPNAGIQDYYLIDDTVRDVTGGITSTTVMPIVHPSQLDEFNAYVVPFLNNQSVMRAYPQLYRMIGGVWTFNEWGLMKEVNGDSPFSNRNLIVPIVNPPFSVVQGGFVLANIHDLEQTGNGKSAGNCILTSLPAFLMIFCCVW